jgi:hypothetical protein
MPANLAQGLALAERLLGIEFFVLQEQRLTAEHLKQETRADRNALASYLNAGTIDIFGVHSLRDVDDNSRFRRGVAWTTYLTPPRGTYIILSEIAAEHVLAHELGHYFGLRHVQTLNNLMSYERDSGPLFLDEAQGASVRRALASKLQSKELVPKAGI